MLSKYRGRTGFTLAELIVIGQSSVNGQILLPELLKDIRTLIEELGALCQGESLKRLASRLERVLKSLIRHIGTVKVVSQKAQVFCAIFPLNLLRKPPMEIFQLRFRYTLIHSLTHGSVYVMILVGTRTILKGA